MTEIILWQPGYTLEVVEKAVILQAYRFYRSNKTQTAQAIGCSVRTLDEKLKIYKESEEEQNERNEKRRRANEDFIRRSRGLPGQTSPQAGKNGDSANAGVRLEPAAKVSSQQSVPVQIGKEVQNVPPKTPTESGKVGASPAVQGANGKAGSSVHHQRK